MKVFSVVLLGLLAATAVLAGPPNVENDAEVVGVRGEPSEASRPEGDGEGGNSNRDGVFLYVPGLRDIRHFFQTVFRRGKGDNEGEGSEAENSTPEEASGRGLFHLFGGSAFRPFFNIFPKTNYTVTFSNSTLRVVDYGGVPMVVNKTIEERKGEDGSVYYSVVQTLVGAYDNSTGLNVTDSSLGLDYADSEGTSTVSTADFEGEPSNRLGHTLTKRWIVSWLKSKLAKRENSETGTHNHLPETRDKEENRGTTNLEKREETEPEINSLNNMNTGHLEKEKEEEGATGEVISYIGDTDVNFLGPPRAVNPDAEVFDVELMRDAENHFLERRRSGSPRNLPIRSEPLRSQPLSSHPITSQPLSTRPHSYYPVRSQPIRSQPIRSLPIRSQPIRSQPLISRPLREGYVRL